MTQSRLRLVFIGLSLSSSWGNGHATTYRSLLKGLGQLGHDTLFLECDKPWYAQNRDLADPAYCRLEFFTDTADLRRYRDQLLQADAVIIGSFVPDGVEVARYVQATAPGIVAFYDIDTPVTLRKLEAEDYEYLSPSLIPNFDLYLSFTGGPSLRRLERLHGARRAVTLYCSVDPSEYRAIEPLDKWDLGYLGTYSEDRQIALEQLLIEPARARPELRFVVAGAQYPTTISWPKNVTRIEHLSPMQHARFYSGLRLALNITRNEMKMAGYSPSVRLFEAASCGCAMVSDLWQGLDELFEPGSEILLAEQTDNILQILDYMDEEMRSNIGEAGRTRVIAEHTSLHRANQLVTLLRQTIDQKLGLLQAAS